MDAGTVFFLYLLFTKACTDLVTKVLAFYSPRHGCRYFFFYFLFTKACTDIVQNYSPLFTKAWMQVLPVWDKKSSLHFLLFHYVKMQHIVPGSHADFVFIFLFASLSQSAKRSCLHTHTHTHTHTHFDTLSK